MIPGRDSVFRITANFNVESEQWEMVKYNNEVLDSLSISHDQIINGGHLNFIINR